MQFKPASRYTLTKPSQGKPVHELYESYSKGQKVVKSIFEKRRSIETFKNYLDNQCKFKAMAKKNDKDRDAQ